MRIISMLAFTLSPRLRLWLHGLAAAAIGGAVTTLSRLFLSPANVCFDAAHLHSYAASAFGGAIIAVLAYFKQSPVVPAGIAAGKSA